MAKRSAGLEHSEPSTPTTTWLMIFPFWRRVLVVEACQPALGAAQGVGRTVTAAKPSPQPLWIQSICFGIPLLLLCADFIKGGSVVAANSVSGNTMSAFD